MYRPGQDGRFGCRQGFAGTPLQKWKQVTPGAQKSRHRVARQGKYNSLPPQSPEPERFAGPLRHLVKKCFHTKRGQYLRQKIKFSLRNSAAQNDEFEFGKNGFQTCGYRRAIIRKMKNTAVRVEAAIQQGLHGIHIRAADLVRKRRFRNVDQFVAGGNDGCFGPGTHQKTGFSDRCSGSDFGGADFFTGLYQPVARAPVGAANVYVLPLIDPLAHHCGHAGGYLQVFVPNHSIGAFGQHGAGHYFDAGIRVGKRLLCLPGSLDAPHGEVPSPCRERRMPNRHAVHRHPVEGREVAVGADVFAQNAPERLFQPDSFPRQVQGIFKNDFFRLSDAEHVVNLLGKDNNTMSAFTHLDASGNPSMVDVGAKPATRRTAVACAIVYLPEEVLEHFGGNDIHSKKGPVFQTAIIAGIMGAKRTGELIPLCHPLGLDNCHLDIGLNEKREVLIQCTASITAPTGVEMEALTGASIAALTIYDMCKALSHDIVIREICLMEKTGGKRDFRRN